jgi:hypothetical protein
MGNVPLPPNQQVLSDAYYAGAMADVYFYFFYGPKRATSFEQ